MYNEGMTTAQALRTEAAAHEQAARDSFDRCDTDGFLSQWASDITARLKRRQAEILDNGGMAEFPALFTLDGERVNARLIDGRFGTCWAICDDNDRFTGDFVKAFPKRESTMTKKGYREGREMAPAAAKIDGSGRGLAGAASCYVRVYRTDGK